MFWRSSTNKEVKDKTASKPSSHPFHVNPSKSWGYYTSTSQAELLCLIKAKKNDTATTTESSKWSLNWGTHSHEQDEEDCMDVEVDDDDDSNSDDDDDIIMTPEGINRTPFTTWEVDLLGTARLSSYYQSRVYSSLKNTHSAAFKLAAQNSNTPNNSPRRLRL